MGKLQSHHVSALCLQRADLDIFTTTEKVLKPNGRVLTIWQIVTLIFMLTPSQLNKVGPQRKSFSNYHAI